jgi:hypothetical protein
LIVEIEGGISAEMKAVLDERCPGFSEDVAAYPRAHPSEREFLWLRLISWLDREIFGSVQAEG